MASISPGIAFNNLTRSVQERYSVNVRHLPKKNIESVFRSVTEERYTMPPLVLSQDKTMLLDRKSPLSANDYRVLFNVTSTKRQLFGLARKLHLLGYKDLTKVDLVEQIKEKLSVTGICEPVELIQKRKSTKPVSVIPNNVPFNNKNNKNYNFETPKNNNNINFGTRKNNNNFNFGTPKNNNNNRSPSSVNISSVGTSTNQATIPVETGVKSPNVSTTSSAPRTIFTSSSRAAAPVSVGSVTRTIRKRPINTINDYNNFNNGLDTNQRGGFFSRIFSGTGRTKKSKKQDVETFMKKQNSPQKTNNTKPRQNSPQKTNNTKPKQNVTTTADKLRTFYNMTSEYDIQKISTYYDTRYSKAPNSQIPGSLYAANAGGVLGVIKRNTSTIYSIHGFIKGYEKTDDKVLLRMMKKMLYDEYVKHLSQLETKSGISQNPENVIDSMYRFVKKNEVSGMNTKNRTRFFDLKHTKLSKNNQNLAKKMANNIIGVSAPTTNNLKRRFEKLRKTNAPKANAPKANAPKANAPKANAPKANAPKANAPKANAPKANAPKANAPKANAPKANAPKANAPKANAPKANAPKTNSTQQNKNQFKNPSNQTLPNNVTVENIPDPEAGGQRRV
jgi:hypothetical protein